MADANVEATERLARVVATLSDADLARDLGAGWTVTTALGHLAFWDRQERLALAAWPDRVSTGDEVNAALEPLLTALEPRAAARLAVESARDLDGELEALSEATRAEIVGGGYGYIVERAPHRLEHLVQIEAAVAKTG
jgi:uncharacterized damage-inducible protein DinB